MSSANDSGLWRPRVVDDGLSLTLGNDIAALEPGRRALRGFLCSRDVSAGGLHRAELVFEETVTNVLRHAYRDRSQGGHAIDVSIRVEGDDIVLIIEDNGPPFDPIDVPAPPSPPSIEDAKLGSLGLVLVRKTAKQMQYERAGGRNRLKISIAKG